MIGRFFVSMALASLGFYGVTGSAFAATIEDREDVMILTGVVAAGWMALLTLLMRGTGAALNRPEGRQ